MAPDDIVAMYPQLTLAQIHGALTFYFDNREESERQIQEDVDFVRAMKGTHKRVATPAPVGMEADADPLSS